MKLSGLILAILVLVASNLSSAQIVIDWTELPQTVGTAWTKNIADDVTVNLGSTGGGQTWTYTSQPMGSDSGSAAIVNKSSTPFADSFPSANLVYLTLADGDAMYLYQKLTSGSWSTQGYGVTGTVTMAVYYDPIDTVPLPITYGSSRNYQYGYEVEMGPNIVMRTEKYGRTIIDAWGTVVIPYGSFPCLRQCSYDTVAVTTLLNGIPIFGDTSNYINYAFVAEDRSGVVCIFSNPDETNPNYTDAASLERLTYFSTGIEELTNGQIRFLSHCPNPFSDYVEISYSLLKPSYLNLTIYDANGRLIRTLVDEIRPQGNHKVKWNGRNEAGHMLPNGVYFYQLWNDGTSAMGKMLLIR